MRLEAIAGPLQNETRIVIAAPSRIVIATRESRLALWQAGHVKSRLEALYPACKVVLLGMTTRGDQVLDRPLAKIGGKGLFVKELENALLDRSADIAVHSMKDVPMILPQGLALIATAAREVPLDAFVSNKYAALDDLPPGAVVGSLRGASQAATSGRSASASIPSAPCPAAGSDASAESIARIRAASPSRVSPAAASMIAS